MENLSENLARVRERVRRAAERAGRDPAEITIVAVTKGVDAATVQAALELGITDIGENRVQEARDKFARLPMGPGVRRHMIGHLQTNKVRQALALFDVIHSLDRPELAAELSRRATALGRVVPVLVQVNVAREPTKHGLEPEKVLDFIREAAKLPGLRIEGLMTIAPLTNDPETVRPVFRRLRELSRQVEEAGIEGVRMQCLSMGMTNDFEVAVEEGSTCIRVGTALFGVRKA
ncbi:MAG: YggS family pyridoxal phosphate-dependent enzyme [Bacillota bacterium]